MPGRIPSVAVVDYGLGNLYSISRACEHAGLAPVVTDAGDALAAADAVLLPGVGAFGDAMAALAERDLVGPLQDLAAAGKPLIGICLGLQLLFERSAEFGAHDGLGILAGTVDRLPATEGLKIPRVGWQPVLPPEGVDWAGSPLADVAAGAHLYFVHSYYVTPADPDVVLASTPFGSHAFCSAVQRGNIFACQFHPERSGPVGLAVYAAVARRLSEGGSP